MAQANSDGSETTTVFHLQLSIGSHKISQTTDCHTIYLTCLPIYNGWLHGWILSQHPTLDFYKIRVGQFASQPMKCKIGIRSFFIGFSDSSSNLGRLKHIIRNCFRGVYLTRRILGGSKCVCISVRQQSFNRVSI